jgi:hypothetical protein
MSPNNPPGFIGSLPISWRPRANQRSVKDRRWWIIRFTLTCTDLLGNIIASMLAEMFTMSLASVQDQDLLLLLENSKWNVVCELCEPSFVVHSTDLR